MFKCKQLLRRICVVSYVFLLCGGLVNASNLVSKTNTLIGTQGNGWASGYLYPGATYPFGMVQFTPTYFTTTRLCYQSIEWCGMRSYGKFLYASDCRSFTGFSG